MKAPKRDKLTSAMKGQPDHSNEQVLAQMAQEVWNANQNTLVAHWIKENPGVPADEITLVHWSDSEGVHFKVVRQAKVDSDNTSDERVEESPKNEHDEVA